MVEYSLARKLAALSPDSTVPPSPTSQIANPSGLTTGVTEEIATNEQTPLLHLDRKKLFASVYSGSIGAFESLAVTRTRLLIAISYASFSGIISGMCLLFAKSGVELLLLTIRGHNQFWRWQSWMLLFALGVFALLQLWYLHKGLVLADPTDVVG
jgi:magnesium transporter